jgi:hypothetical protein
MVEMVTTRAQSQGPWLGRAILGLMIAGCGAPAAAPDAPPGPVDATPDAPPVAALDAAPDARPAVYGDVYGAIDQDRLVTTLRELGGDVPVTVGGETYAISERYSEVGREHFRRYWRAAFEAMGLTVRAIDYQDPQSSRPGHDLEAVLPGKSPDSIVVIVHYDSIGPPGQETGNPGVDDDMTGMAILLETARVLVPYQGRLAHTVRFVATDEEELGGLAGARAYAHLILDEATAGGFALVAAVDDEQTGWNCMSEGACGGVATWPAFDVFSCGDQFDNPALGDQLEAVVHDFSTIGVVRGCLGANSDHYAMWEIGVPSVVFTEHNPFGNPHFDQNGGDTFAKIDVGYFAAIARPAITFQATLIGIDPP